MPVLSKFYAGYPRNPKHAAYLSDRSVRSGAESDFERTACAKIRILFCSGINKL